MKDIELQKTLDTKVPIQGCVKTRKLDLIAEASSRFRRHERAFYLAVSIAKKQTEEITLRASNSREFSHSLGHSDIEGDSWVGVLVPAGTPMEIINVLYRAIVAVITEPETRDRLIALGYEPVAGTPDDFGRLIGAELQLWKDVVRRANIERR